MANYFLTKKIDTQVKEIIKSNDLVFLQVFIGKRCPALLQYCASFYISRINILEIEYEIDNKIIKTAFDYYLKNDKTPEKLTSESPALSEIINEVKADLKTNKILLPIASEDQKYFLYDKCKDVKSYVKETNIGNLSLISNEVVNHIYDKALETRLSYIDLSGSLEDVKARLKKELPKLEKRIEITEKELEDNKKKLLEMKEETFLQDWYRNLSHKFIDKVNDNSNHILYNDVFEYSKGKQLSFVQKDLIMKDICKVKNIELLKISWNNIVQDNLDFEKHDKEVAFKKVLGICSGDLANENILTTDFVDKFCESLKNHPELHENQIIIDFVSKFSLSNLIESEQRFLDKGLTCALEHRKNDAALLFIFNGANSDYVLKKSTLNFEKPAIIEIKRIYKNMPIKNMDDLNLPCFSLEEIKTIFPSDHILSITAKKISAQKNDITAERTAKEKSFEECVNSSWYYFFWWIIDILHKNRMRQIENAEKQIENLESACCESAAFGNAQILFEELPEINNESWFTSIFSHNRRLFKELDKLSEDFTPCKISSVGKMMMDLNNSRKGYIKFMLEETSFKNALEMAKSMTKTLTEQNETNEKEKLDLILENARAELEREQNRILREMSQREIFKREALDEAQELFYEEAQELNLKLKDICPDIRSFLKDIYVFYILNNKFENEFNLLNEEYQKIEPLLAEKEIDKTTLTSINQKLSHLDAKHKCLKRWFSEYEDEENRCLACIIPCSNEQTNSFQKNAVEKMKQARIKAAKMLEKVSFKKYTIEKEIKIIF